MRRLSCVAIALSLAYASPTQAQLRLPKIKNPVSGAIARAVPSSRAVKFDENVLEITAERMTAFSRGLEAEARMAAKVEAQDVESINRRNAAAQAAYEQTDAEYQAKREARQACGEREMKPAEAQAAALQPTESDQARMEAVAARVQAAHKRGDAVEAKRLVDSLVNGATMKRTNQAVASVTKGQANAIARCGPAPIEPEKPVRIALLTYHEVQQAGIKASGFTPMQYQIMRERIAPFVVSNGKSSSFAYSDEENRTLSANLGALSAHVELLQRG